ncbi:hypothetical protein B1B_05559, partial [mine drainage metagenome]
EVAEAISARPCYKPPKRASEKIQARVAAGRLRGDDQIGLKVGQIMDRYQMAKHFTWDIHDTSFSFTRKTADIAAEADSGWDIHHPHLGPGRSDGGL